jgi:acid phosphatase family membrane protein YuiD
MTGTAAGVGWYEGFQDPLFALAAAVAFVVLYDASGVRRASGETAARLNALVQSQPAVAGTEVSRWPTPLKENIGHTRLEVLVGALLGPLVALPGLALLGSPLHLAQSLSHTLPAALG